MLFSEGNYHRRENNPRFPINKWSILARSHPVDPGMGEDWLHQAPGLTCLVLYNVDKHPTVDESKFTFRSIAFHSSLWLEHANMHIVIDFASPDFGMFVCSSRTP